LAMLTLLWLGMCWLLLHEYLASPSEVLLAVLGLFIAGVLAKLVLFDLPSLGLGESLVYSGPYSFFDALMRLLDLGATAAFFVLVFAWLRGVRGQPNAAKLAGCGWLALGLAFVFLTLELNTFLSYFVPTLRAGGISILWSLFALGLIVAG